MSKKFIYKIIDNQVLKLTIDYNINFDMLFKSIKLNNSIQCIKITSPKIKEIPFSYTDRIVFVNRRFHNRTLEELNKDYDDFNNFLKTLFDFINNHSNIISLDLSNIILNDKRENDIILFNLYSFLQKNKTIKILNLSHNNFSKDMFKIISNSLQFNNIILENLDLSYCLFNDVKDDTLNFLLTNKTIKILNLSHTNFSKDMIKIILNFLQHNNNIILENLDLSYCLINDVKDIFNFLLTNKTLKKINLSNNYITNISNLDNVINKNKTLEIIDLSFNHITDARNKNNIIYASNNFHEDLDSVYNILQSYLKLINNSNVNVDDLQNMITNTLYKNEEYNEKLIKNIVINTINNTNIQKIDLSFNDIHNIKPFLKVFNKINRYSYNILEEDNKEYRQKLDIFLKNNFNINYNEYIYNEDFKNRLNKINSDIILIWGNPGIIGGCI